MDVLQVLGQAVLPMCLAFMMFSLGLSLTPQDFSRIIISPRPMLLGIGMQLLLLPMIAWILLCSVHSFIPLSNEVVLGIVILAACPGGATSNIISHLSGGDGALSVSITAVVSLMMPFILPFSLAFQLLWWDENMAIALPIMKTIGQLLLITVMPVLLAMLIRWRWSSQVILLEAKIRQLSSAVFLLLVLSLMHGQWPQLKVMGWGVAALCLSLCVCSMLAAYVIARWHGCGHKATKTLSIEVGIQNAGTGIFIAAGLLNQPLLALVPLMYGLVMNIPAFILIVINLYHSRSQ